MSESRSVVALEKKKVDELRRVASSLDSPDAAVMYTAAGKMIAHPDARALLAKAFSLAGSDDVTMRRLVFRTIGKNAYGPYVEALFEALKNINPAEREQVLQVIEENFQVIGPPRSTSEQERWTSSLASLGREHQPTAFGIMSLLDAKGFKHVERVVREQIETVSLGSIQRLSSFEPEPRSALVRVLMRASLSKRRDLLPYVLELLDAKTVQLAAPCLKSNDWRDRVQVAAAVGKCGILTTAGIVTDLIADTDWRVKQALLDSIVPEKSKFSSLLQLLGFLVNDSHVRVRSAADRLLLMLGARPTMGSDVEGQRKKLMRRFRKQLLRSAPHNKDIDTAWLGVDTSETNHIPYFPAEEETPGTESGEAGPEGVSLTDLGSTPQSEKKKEPPAEKQDLLSALLSARKAAGPDTEPQATAAIEESAGDQTPVGRFVRLLKTLSGGTGEMDLARLREKALEGSFTASEFDKTLDQLERDGIVYRSGKGQLKYVDIEL